MFLYTYEVQNKINKTKEMLAGESNYAVYLIKTGNVYRQFLGDRGVVTPIFKTCGDKHCNKYASLNERCGVVALRNFESD